jgi:ATP synthase I subunit
MELDEHYLARSVGRMYVSMAVMSAAGVLALLVWQGWRWGLGFALGAAASWLNFRWLKKVVDSLAQAAAGKRLKSRTAVLLGLRYVLLAAAGYAILRFSEISLTAALVGLFVSAAAVILEIVYQLIAYGST